MDSLIDTFHIDWKLLLAQTINFAIVFFVLYKFAFKPLAKTMADRTNKIETGLKQAKDIEAKLAATKVEQEEIIHQARQEAIEVIKQAQVQAEERKEKMVQKAKQEIGQIIQGEKDKLHQEKSNILKELKTETAELIALSLEKILNQKMDSKQDQELIKKIIK